MNEQIVRDGAIAVYVVVAFLLGGGTAIAAIGLFANQILKSPVIIKAIETWAKGIDPATLAAINATAKVIDEATDDIPADEKIKIAAEKAVQKALAVNNTYAFATGEINNAALVDIPKVGDDVKVDE